MVPGVVIGERAAEEIKTEQPAGGVGVVEVRRAQARCNHVAVGYEAAHGSAWKENGMPTDGTLVILRPDFHQTIGHWLALGSGE
jgi:hypothetical protein